MALNGQTVPQGLEIEKIPLQLIFNHPRSSSLPGSAPDAMNLREAALQINQYLAGFAAIHRW